MGRTLRSIFLLCISLVVAGMLAGCGGFRPASNAKANQPLKQETISKLASMGSSPGAGMMIRIFKETSELEVWKQTSAGYKLFNSYAICAWSCDLGPNVNEGDRQSP